MNKFVAMMRDSYREAVDGWIFPVMLVLAGILILLVLSFGAEPLPVDEAIGRSMAGQTLSTISPDRGRAPKIALFLFQSSVPSVTVTRPGAKPWESEMRFPVQFVSAGFGPSGVEVDDANKPKDVKKIEGGGLFTDAFKDAVRYWAAPAGTPAKDRPKYTNDLGAEFVAQQIRDTTRLNVTKVEKIDGPGETFEVTVNGGDRLGWQHRPSLFFGLWEMNFLTGPLGELIYIIENGLVNTLGAGILLMVGVVVTAGFVPNMLRKGAIDLLLTKPMSRPLILVFKYFGGLLFVFLLTAVAVGGVWVALGLKTGVWAPGLLYAIGGITFYFAILYSVSTLAGVLTRNAIVSIVVTVTFYGVLFLIGWVNGLVGTLNALEVQQVRQTAPAPKTAEQKKDGASDKNDKKEAKPKPAPGEEGADESTEPRRVAQIPDWLTTTLKWVNRATPRTSDLDAVTQELIGRGLLSPAAVHRSELKEKSISWVEVLAVAGVYIAFFLGLAMVRFVTRSY